MGFQPPEIQQLGFRIRRDELSELWIYSIPLRQMSEMYTIAGCALYGNSIVHGESK